MSRPPMTPPPRRTLARRALAGPLAAAVALSPALAAPAPPAHAQAIGNRDLYEKSLEVARRAAEQYELVDDAAETRRVADVGYRVARASRYDGYPLTFHLIDMPEPNAFALPGGQIFVTRGMLDLGLDDDMLAALLGHEIAHVALDHHSKMQRRATLMNLLGQALLVGVLIGADGGSQPHADDPGARWDPEVRNQRGEMIQGAAATSLIVSELLLRSFSREHEDQADAEGQRWAAAAGFDPAGANRLFVLMQSRLPQSKQYGYWRTHPFFDERVRAGGARAGLLKRDDTPADADSFRQRTQAALLAWADEVTVIDEDGYHDEVGEVSASTVRFVEAEALASWPRGPAAERIRQAALDRRRNEEMGHEPLARDYGALLAAWDRQIEEVAALDPETEFLGLLREQRKGLAEQAASLYQRAQEVLAGGVYETAFLERFLSNWPEAAEVPKVALSLGDARARLGDQAGAVESYLRVVDTAPGTPEAERAHRGLRVLAPRLDQLTALVRLARQERDPELAELAAARLGETAGAFEDIGDGAELLDRFPDATVAPAVAERINVLAEKLYGEVVLYQAIGDHVKAVERINKILTHAPLSPAADLLRDRAVLAA
ncbi:MAG TPA: M48 family metalloprotease [Thermoanaerobaculia bacterium]|nr:M48 family metalloprotease [Thermoanaerobaculia bacterium]